MPAPRLIYFHLPKCGGSTFGAALRLRYFWSQATIGQQITRSPGPETPAQRKARMEKEYDQRGAILRRLVGRSVRCISAHVRYEAAFMDSAAQDYLRVTLLRDPVERFVSHYTYLQRRHPDPDRPGTLAGFLDTEDAERLGRQYLFYFGGAQADVGQAIKTLRGFDLVGDLGQSQRFRADLNRMAGPLPNLGARNQAPAGTAVPADLRTRIEALCREDRAIYDAVLKEPELQCP